MALFQQLGDLFNAPSVLGWSAWARVAAVLPVLALLWLAVWWASAEVVTL